MLRAFLAVSCLVVTSAALAGASHPGVGLPDPAARTPQDPVPATWHCSPPANLPKPASYTCGTNSSVIYCRGKALDTICGASGGICLYCWQVSGPPDDFGNLPCNCRN